VPNLIPAPASIETLGGEPYRGEPPAGELSGSGAPESYALEVTADRATLTAPDAAGLFRGRQTLEQLREPDGAIAPVRIQDAPRYAHRGVMLDVARHFFGVDDVKRLIDLAASYKLNVLHLHLTDDQGWRLEVRRHPLLTRVGAVRDGHAGYYRQSDIARIVAYAAERHITVVPEIETPGHVQAALAAYPGLGNDPDTRLPVLAGWGISEHVLSAEPAAVDFFRDVLAEVVELFPGRYVHIGGDECPTAEWRRHAAAHAAALGSTGPDGLHGWFLTQLTEYLAGHGRQAVCWADAPDPPPGAVVMSWRDAAGCPGRDVVMTPWRWTYLDYPQVDRPGEPAGQPGLVTVDDVYAFQPEPAAGRVLGTQAQLWTEYMPTPRHVEYMAFPRLCALAEVAWSPAGRDPADFRRRLAAHLPRLDALGVAHGPAELHPQEVACPPPESPIPAPVDGW
jgi:hexosaminidase